MKKWFSATAFAVLLLACTKTETSATTESSATSETSSTAAAASDTSSTVVPVDTGSSTMTPSTGTTSTTTASTSTSGTTSTTSTGATGSTGYTGYTGTTGTTGSSSTTHTENTPLPGPMTSAAPDLVADGAAVYKAKGCAGCHGATGAADTAIARKNNIHDFRSPDVQKMSDGDLAKILKEGKGTVSKTAHKSKNLTDMQVKSLVAWIRTLK